MKVALIIRPQCILGGPRPYIAYDVAPYAVLSYIIGLPLL